MIIYWLTGLGDVGPNSDCVWSKINPWNKIYQVY